MEQSNTLIDDEQHDSLELDDDNDQLSSLQPQPIIDEPSSIYLQHSFSDMVKRNYRRYVISTKTTDNDESDHNNNLVYLRHPSGVIVVILGDQHPALSMHIDEIDFNSKKKGKGVNRSKQHVRGKGKKGGLQLQAETRLCVIRCHQRQSTDNNNSSSTKVEYHIRAGIRGLLVEVNDRLIDQPHLLQTSRENRGYIAIVIPNGSERRYVTQMTLEK